MHALVILGNQLFSPKHFKDFTGMPVFMAEDQELCTYYTFHKHKIILFLSAMRHFRDQLRTSDFEVDYRDLSTDGKISYTEKLAKFVEKHSIRHIHMFEIEDKFMEQRIDSFCQDRAIKLTVHQTPMFTCSRTQFSSYLQGKKKPFMKTFYEAQRRRLDILMEGSTPYGGKFSYDSENRRKLPKDHKLPTPYLYKLDEIDQEVARIVDDRFPDHPGNSHDFCLPTTRKAALAQLQHFLRHRLADFGPYQDAICAGNGTLYHSLISPAMNLGLITPTEVLEKIIVQWKEKDLPIESIEGFVRQVIGWREFVRGIYQSFSTTMESKNQWNSQRKMKPCWYSGETGLPPLDDAINRALKTGYSHHIERLMILANLMNLCEIEPREVYRWFMEMYVDSSDWVMAANVYGMGLMSDGGIFATKPYISGSNYILKMSDYKKGTWCDIWDGLYWRFVEKHFEFFDRNPRMRMMTKTLLKMDSKRKQTIFAAAEEFLVRVTS